MGVIKKRALSLIMAVVLSLILHIAVIAGISGIDLFNFKELFATKPFHAKIISELPKKPHLSKLIRKPSQIQPDNSPQKKETPPVTEENISMIEYPQKNPPMDDMQVEDNDSEVQQTAYKGETIAVEPPMVQDNKSEVQQTASLSVNEKPVEPSKTEDAIQILKSAKEKLYFDIYWVGIYVGNATLEAVNDNGNVKISSQVHSAPLISAFYKVENYAESRLENGMPSFFKIKQWEGRKRSNKETFFDIISSKVTHINHIKGTKDEHSINTKNLWDVMSGFYYLRTQKLNVGETVYINLFDSNKFYQAEVHVLKKEKVRLFNDSEIESVVVKPVLKSEGLFQNKGDISIWLTDDENKIPVRVETEVSIGKITAELKSLETEK